MIGRVNPMTATLFEKAAMDNGFDRELADESNWLGFASTHTPLKIWLAALSDELYLVAFSQGHVANALEDHGAKLASPLPNGAAAGRTVTTIPLLDRMLRRAFQLSRSLPDELLHVFQEKKAALPETTEAERLVVQRVGQDIFRNGLLDYWEGRCAITGLAVKNLLRASHIKPWAQCESDAERLDVFNGLLLAPHLDAAFDAGFITVENDGVVVISPQLSENDCQVLGLDHPLQVAALTDGHQQYLPWHRSKIFRKDGDDA